MPWAAAAAAAAAIGGGLLQSDASKSAAGTQANAANNATQAQLAMFNKLNEQGAPYRAAGVGGLNKLSALLGVTPAGPPGVPAGVDPNTLIDGPQGYWTRPGGGKPDSWIQNPDAPPQAAAPNPSDDPSFGSLLHQFNASDLNSTLAPNYQFQLDQGLGATSNFLNKTGGLVSGNTLRGINDYAQGTAAGAYQQAFQNYTANQTNIFNRLSDIAGLGQTANATTANAGTAISGNAANSMMNAGAASAAGQVGSANALAGGLNNAGSWYALSQFMPKSPSPISAGAE